MCASDARTSSLNVAFPVSAVVERQVIASAASSPKVPAPSSWAKLPLWVSSADKVTSCLNVVGACTASLLGTACDPRVVGPSSWLPFSATSGKVLTSSVPSTSARVSSNCNTVVPEDRRIDGPSTSSLLASRTPAMTLLASIVAPSLTVRSPCTLAPPPTRTSPTTRLSPWTTNASSPGSSTRKKWPTVMLPSTPLWPVRFDWAL
jgi:hypothetical protein